MTGRDKGMTLIEVSIALVILLIGVGFILNSNRVSHHYQYKSQLRQQMTFYAAGMMEALIEGQDILTLGLVDSPPFDNFQVTVMKDPIPVASNATAILEKVTVTVSLKVSSDQPEPVELMTYRLRAR